MPTKTVQLPVRGIVANAGIGVRMREFLARHGEAAALGHFGLSRLSIARAAAGLPLQSATMRVVLIGLEKEVTS